MLTCSLQSAEWQSASSGSRMMSSEVPASRWMGDGDGEREREKGRVAIV